MIKYVVLSVESCRTKNGDDMFVVTTSCFRDGKPVSIWIKPSWQEKNKFVPLMPVDLKWDKEYKRYSSVFPHKEGEIDA